MALVICDDCDGQGIYPCGEAIIRCCHCKETGFIEEELSFCLRCDAEVRIDQLEHEICNACWARADRLEDEMKGN